MPNNTQPTVHSEATTSFAIIDGRLHRLLDGEWTPDDSHYQSSGQSLWVQGFQPSGHYDEDRVWDLHPAPNKTFTIDNGLDGPREHSLKEIVDIAYTDLEEDGRRELEDTDAQTACYNQQQQARNHLDRMGYGEQDWSDISITLDPFVDCFDPSMSEQERLDQDIPF